MTPIQFGSIVAQQSPVGGRLQMLGPFFEGVTSPVTEALDAEPTATERFVLQSIVPVLGTLGVAIGLIAKADSGTLAALFVIAVICSLSAMLSARLGRLAPAVWCAPLAIVVAGAWRLGGLTEESIVEVLIALAVAAICGVAIWRRWVSATDSLLCFCGVQFALFQADIVDGRSTSYQMAQVAIAGVYLALFAFRGRTFGQILAGGILVFNMPSLSGLVFQDNPDAMAAGSWVFVTVVCIARLSLKQPRRSQPRRFVDAMAIAHLGYFIFVPYFSSVPGLQWTFIVFLWAAMFAFLVRVPRIGGGEGAATNAFTAYVFSVVAMSLWRSLELSEVFWFTLAMAVSAVVLAFYIYLYAKRLLTPFDQVAAVGLSSVLFVMVLANSKGLDREEWAASLPGFVFAFGAGAALALIAVRLLLVAPNKKHQLPIYRGFLSGRQAVVVRRVYRSAKENASSLPLLNIVASLISGLGAMSRHLRSNIGIPLLAEGLVLALCGIAFQFYVPLALLIPFPAEGPSAPAVLDMFAGFQDYSLWAIDDLIVAYPAAAVQFGVVLFAVGIAPRQRLLVYIALLFTAAPLILGLYNVAAHFFQNGWFDFEGLGQPCLMSAQGLLACELIRVISGRASRFVRLAYDQNRPEAEPLTPR